MRFRSVRALKFSLLIFSLFYLVGCGSAATDEREHIPIHGQVTLNNTPVGDGVISFIPAKDNSNGSPASTNILAGKYRFNGTEGPSAGRYRVRINPPLPTKEPPPSKDLTESVNPISGGPWEFELTVTEDLTAKGADFELSKQTRKSK
tara:strand:- start:5647 stop:6090 length:444 start_codon:yes stop_codon:yes gene_type:complete